MRAQFSSGLRHLTQRMIYGSNSPARLHGLDTLRALAILAVVLYHFNIQGLLPPALQPAARAGWIGVDLFFVLSGFLIGSQLLSPYRSGTEPSLKDFYARRAYRILPAFFVVLLLYAGVPLWREAPGLYSSWQYDTFTWNLLLRGYPANRAFSHVWSLCVEEQFYLILPLLILWCMRAPSVVKTVLICSGILLSGMALRTWVMYRVIAPSDDEQGLLMMKYIYYPTYSRLDGLLAGVSLALLRTFRPGIWSRLTRQSTLLTACGVAAVVSGLWLCAFDYPSPALPFSIVFAFPLLALGFGLLVAAAASQYGLLSRRIPGAGTLATLAFSLYLTHKSVAHAAHLLLPKTTAQPGWQASGVYALACLGVATALYLLVERPFLALRARRSRHNRPSEVAQEVRLDPAI